jgi:hypothetical protein
LTTYYVLFFIDLETRRVSLAGFTSYPDKEWMEQQARNMTMEEWGCLRGCRYLLHDRDAKVCQSFSRTDQDRKRESASIASHGSSAVSRTTGRPAEVLREGSGIKVDGTAGDGLTTYIEDTGNLDWQKTSRA